MTVQEFFAALPSKVDPAKTAGMNNSYVFDITGVGAWTVSVADGAVSVAEGEHDADCTLAASEETLMKIARGEANRDDRLHDRQVEDQGRHGRRAEAAEALLGTQDGVDAAHVSGRSPARRLGRKRPGVDRRRLGLLGDHDRALGVAPARGRRLRPRERLPQAPAHVHRDPADHPDFRDRLLLRQRRDPCVHRVGRAELLDRRLLDVCRRRDRDVARQRRRRRLLRAIEGDGQFSRRDSRASELDEQLPRPRRGRRSRRARR